MENVNLTQENFAKLAQFTENNKDVKGCLIPILQEAQNIFGYLPIEVQKNISDALNVSAAEIYGVVTFYSQFTLVPKGKYTIAVCMGTACYVKGSQNIVDRLKRELNLEVGETSADGLYTLEATRCIGACGLSPALTVNGEVYGRLKDEDIPVILRKYQ